MQTLLFRFDLTEMMYVGLYRGYSWGLQSKVGPRSDPEARHLAKTLQGHSAQSAVLLGCKMPWLPHMHCWHETVQQFAVQAKLISEARFYKIHIDAAWNSETAASSCPQVRASPLGDSKFENMASAAAPSVFM